MQRPGVKINHALLLGSNDQGTGKDTAIAPVRHAVGPWNAQDVSPQQLLGRFNGFLKCVMLRINETRDLGDVERYAFYEHIKVYCASPPEVLMIDEKNIREYQVFNVCGVVLTSNHKSGGMFLPAEDRRTYVAWSNVKASDFEASYFNDLWDWYRDGGFEHCAAFLHARDISGFDPKAPPQKTAAFWAIVASDKSSEDAALLDVIDAMDAKAVHAV